MGKKLRSTSGGSTEHGNVYLFRNMGSFETIFVDDASQVALRSVQPTRNLPNILRGSNTKAYKNYKTFALDKNDVSLVSLAQDVNTSFDLSVALSSDLERDGRYSKVASPRSHHQRKQVHYPLDARCDVPSWNNNNNNDSNINNKNKKNKDASNTIDELEALYVSLGHEEDIPTKKTNNRANGERRRCLFKTSTLAATGKSIGKKTSGFSSVVVADVNTADSRLAAQSGNSFLVDDDVSCDTIEPDNKSNEWPSIFYRNNDVYKLQERGNANCNSVISGRATECSAIQQNAGLQKDPLSYEFTAGVDGFVGNPVSNNNRSNFLLASGVLCTCTCANCTICDQDFVLCEEPVPNYVNSDMETELYAPYAYDFYTSDYYHVLGDIDGFDKIFSYEVAEDTRENVRNDDDVVNYDPATLVETNASVANANMSVKQRELKDSCTLCTDRVQDTCVESNPVELVILSDESTGPAKAAEQIRRLDEVGYFNLESFSMDMSEMTSQNQDKTCTNVLAPVPNDRPCKNKKDLCVIQCAQCNRVFSKKKFRRHFTHCTFCKEDFKCHVCSKTYRYKSSLVHHLKTMHNVLNNVYEKYYVCSKCDKPYVRFRAFQRHLLVHNNW